MANSTVEDTMDPPVKLEFQASTPGHHGDTDPRPPKTYSFTTLQADAQSETVQELERAVQNAKPLLYAVAEALTKSKDNGFVNKKLKVVRNLLEASNKNFILGVVGGTGQGKSSLINTLLDEVELVGTDCVKACTAVATEISWNGSEQEDERYIAEIEYITTDEWLAELSLLFDDLNDEEEGSSRASETGIAWAKIRAVYPGLTKQAAKNCDAQTLASDVDIQSLLGQTKVIRAPSVQEYKKRIRPFLIVRKRTCDVNYAVSDQPQSELVVEPEDDFIIENSDDENENAHYSPDGNSKDKVKTQSWAVWPLIKKVRVRTRAKILATGLVLVDLPGSSDSNAARDAVADQFIKKCDGLCVVANINRAVNDKVAQNLLGQSFKQQLILDGNYGNITLVCSKTDDLSVEEARKQFKLHKEYGMYKRANTALEEWNEEFKLKVEAMSSRSDALLSFLTELSRTSEVWNKLLLDAEEGKRAIVTQLLTRKRTLPPTGDTPNKKRTRQGKRNRVSYNEEGSSLVERLANTADDAWDKLKAGPPMPSSGTEVSIEAIKTMIAHLDSSRAYATKARDSIDASLAEQRQKKNELTESCEAVEIRYKKACLEARNKFAQNEARKQFEAGLREMDHADDLTQALDKADTNLTALDYRKLAAKLPVYCVSSRAYQVLEELIDGEDIGEEFEELEDTQIPQLRQHAVNITEIGRKRHCRKSLNDAIELLGSLRLWANDEAWAHSLTIEGRQRQMQIHDQAVAELEKGMRDCVLGYMASCREVSDHRTFDKLDLSIGKASRAAAQAAEKWPRRSRGGPGLPAQSYRAVCRRDGKHATKTYSYDFNQDLVEPLIKLLSKGWQETFVSHVPASLKPFSAKILRLLEQFHDKRMDSLQNNVPPSTLNTLEIQYQARRRNLPRMVDQFAKNIDNDQKGVNREFKPAVQKAMSNTYMAISLERGTGCFSRMQERMEQEVVQNGHAAFQAVASQMRITVENLFARNEVKMSEKITEMIHDIDQDYGSVISKTTTADTKVTRDEMKTILEDFYRETAAVSQSQVKQECQV